MTLLFLRYEEAANSLPLLLSYAEERHSSRPPANNICNNSSIMDRLDNVKNNFSIWGLSPQIMTRNMLNRIFFLADEPLNAATEGLSCPKCYLVTSPAEGDKSASIVMKSATRPVKRINSAIALSRLFALLREPQGSAFKRARR